jgi:anaerobic magnesium-protoporphyrin IX monomethyl ester cyclase
MDLLLTHGFFLGEDAKELRVMKPYPPLGLLYLSSHLRARGFDVELYDSTFGTREELLRLLRAGPPAVLGIGVNLLTRHAALDIVAAARAAGWCVVVGGPEPANYAAEYLDAGAHVVVDGEGEVTMEELLPQLRARNFSGFNFSGLDQVPGIFFRDAAGALVRTAPRPLIADLDAQPWPDRERVDIPRYLQAWRERHGTGSVSVITARGCPYHCRWCSHSVFGKTHRRRSPAGVANEVEWVLDRYSPDMLWMADDVFTIHHGWLFEYARELRRRGLRIPFECITRADRMNPRVVDTLADMGCFRVWIGSESGSQRVLDRMERGVTVGQVRNAVELCRHAGIQTGMFLMWGYEGEDANDIQLTIDHVKACLPDTFLTTVSYPIKGTPYYEEAASRLVAIDGWSRSSDRDVRIRGRHSRRYYEFADQLLKGEVELVRTPAAERAALVARIESARAGLSAAAAETEA